MKSPRTPSRLIAIPDKPLKEYTQSDVELLRAPSVEQTLDNIRGTLALVAMIGNLQSCVSEEDVPLPRGGAQTDAARKLAEITEAAWQDARRLSEGLDDNVHNLRVVDDGDDRDEQ